MAFSEGKNNKKEMVRPDRQAKLLEARFKMLDELSSFVAAGLPRGVEMSTEKYSK